jgi:hypothetical protein
MNDKTSQPEFEQVSDSKNLSQLIRSNAPEYWAYMKHKADLRKLGPYMPFVGAVAGDPHLGNFAPLPVTTHGGTREMRFVNVDFDDCGRAPFVLDYVRYASAIKAQCDEMKNEVLQEAYLSGLKGKKAVPPPKVQDLLDMKVSEYDRQADEYTAKHTSGREFEMKKGAIEPYSGKLEDSTIARLFPGEKVHNLADRIEARGGSSDEKRIWALVEAGDSRQRIMELKQYAAPGTASYQLQPPVKEWLSEIRQAFWPGLTGSEYDLVTLDKEWFWIREKRVSLIDVPYSSQKQHDTDFVIALATFDGNLLGRAHGSQAQGSAYLAAIEHDEAAFHQATKEVEKAYLESAREAFEKKASAKA